MPREDLITPFAAAFYRAAERLRAEGHEDPWPDDLWPRDVVRLLRERSRLITVDLCDPEAEKKEPAPD
jgi:hypothetical protein